MLLQLLFAVAVLSAKVRSAAPRGQIIYKRDETFDSNCTLADATVGECRSADECLTLGMESEVKTCYFEGFRQFVCCRVGKLDRAELGQRPAIQACLDAYPKVYFIINGLATAPKEFPYMAALGWKSFRKDLYDFHCGGVFVAERFVLTAAHCVDFNGAAPTVVLPGGANLTDTTDQKYAIAQIIVHPGYRTTAAYDDIALIKLATTLDFIKTYYRPICLFTKNAVRSTERITAIGYGHIQFAGPSSLQLLKAQLASVPNKECQQHYKQDSNVNRGILDTQICAMDPENYRDTCQGDSGGPIVLEYYLGEDKYPRPHVIGITSFGKGCASGSPGVYTRISAYIDWIEHIVWPTGTAEHS